MVFSTKFVCSLVKNIFPTLRKTQGVNLSLSTYGQLMSQSTVMSEMVREVPGAVKHRHRLKRLWRFVSNPRVKPERLFEFWIPWCISKFNPIRYVSVALDWTTLPGNNQCLMASLLYQGRAIPLLWQVVKYRQIRDSQNRIEERLVARLVNLLPCKKRLVLTADRGFGRASFFRFLLKKNILFTIRVKADVRIWPQKGRAFLLRTLAKKLLPNTLVWYPSVSYRDDCAVARINLAAVVAQGSTDPWFVITNLKSATSTIHHYAQRFQIEEGFKDTKHPLGFDRIQTRNLTRMRRLLLVTALSQALALLVGQTAWRMKSVKEQIIATSANTCSRLWFGIQIIRHHLLRQPFWRRVRYVALGP